MLAVSKTRNDNSAGNVCKHKSAVGLATFSVI